MGTTEVTLTNGRTLTIAQTYEDAKAYLLVKSVEHREVTLACGARTTLNVGLIGTIDEVIDTEKREVGIVAAEARAKAAV